MKLTDEERVALVDYRFRKSSQAMLEAEDLARLGHWSLTAQRLYYAAYYVASAKLIEKGITAKTHAGVISLLNLHLVKNGTLTQQDARIYMRLFEMVNRVTMTIILTTPKKMFCHTSQKPKNSFHI